MRLTHMLFVLGLLVPSGRARADAVAIPDVTCPEGTSITANHGGHWCVPPRSCTTDAECGSLVCSPTPTSLCVATETYTVGGRLAGQAPTTRSVEVGRGPCDASCTSPLRCATERRCIAPSPAPATSPAAQTSAPEPQSGCRAASGPRSGLGTAVVALAACACALRRRRSRALR